MAARSVAELLGRPFEQLDLDDVARIAREIGDERETLFFERKRSFNRDGIAKACAAFANTLGGLLVVGVTDDGEIVGTTSEHAEAQVWVKDVLRPAVLPLPPFRARWLPIEGDNTGVLLVLVEQSSTTPHLLARRGAIYVRSPGSSDPLPLADQRRLFELADRGETTATAALETARTLSHESLSSNEGKITSYIALGAVPTGAGASWDARVMRTQTPDDIATRLWGTLDPDRRRIEARLPYWSAGELRVERIRAARSGGTLVEPVVVKRSGGIGYGDGRVLRGAGLDDEGYTRSTGAIAAWLAQTLEKLRDILLDLGAHGDLAIALRVDMQRGLECERADGTGTEYRRPPADFGGSVLVERWTTLDQDEERDARLRDSIVDDLRVIFGAPPLR